MNYQLLKSSIRDTEPRQVLMLVDGQPVMTIPFDPANTDYQAYLRWLEEGNTPLPADEPDPIPEPEPLTAQQKLEAAGLTIEELKDLLGL